MELRHLRYFHAIAEEQNFSRAAKRLHISQSALSMQMQDLEEELGVVLFLRSNRRTELTTAGVLFQVEAERVITQAERAKEVAAKAASGHTGQLRIGFSGVAAASGKLVQDLTAFRNSFQEIGFALSEMAPPFQAAAIKRGELDFGYVPAFGAAFETELVADVLESWPWLVAMSVHHGLAVREDVTPSDLTREEFILYAVSDLYIGQLTVLYKLLGHEPRIVQRATNMLSLLTLVSAGFGMALVPSPLTTVQMPDLTFRPIKDSADSIRLLLLSSKEQDAKAAQSFRKIALRRTIESAG